MTGTQRHLSQYPTYGKSIGGATVDNNVGWSNPDAQGYSEVPGASNLQCAAGTQDCHGRGICFDLQTNPLYCGSCQTTCDFYTEVSLSA